MNSINIGMRSRGEGWYRLETVRQDGSVSQDTGWFHNLITDQGCDQRFNPPVYNTEYGVRYLNTHCAVGDGSAAPSATDSQLASRVANFPSSPASNVQGGTTTFVDGSQPYWKTVWTYTFPVGAAAGNLTEVGVGGMLNGDTEVRLFSRALIVDGVGDPTTISPASDESLRVTYELREYIDTGDAAYSFDMEGVTYSGTLRRCDIDSPPGNLDQAISRGPFENIALYVYNGSIGTAYNNPTGTQGGGVNDSSISQQAYAAPNKYRDFTCHFGLSNGNLSGGITAIKISSPVGSWQMSVSPAIPKDGTKQMDLNFRIAWDRYTP